MSDESQDDAETGPGEQSAVLSVRNLPYLAEDLRVQSGSLEEGYGAFTSDDAQLISVGKSEEVCKSAFFVGGEVQDGGVCDRVSLLRHPVESGLRHTRIIAFGHVAVYCTLASGSGGSAAERRLLTRSLYAEQKQREWACMSWLLDSE